MWFAIHLVGAAGLFVISLAACELVVEERATTATASTVEVPNTGMRATTTVATPPHADTPTVTLLSTDTSQPLPTSPATTPLPIPGPFNLEMSGRHCSEFPLQRAVQQASVIAVGSVKEVLPSHWTTDNGERPPPPWQFGTPDAGIVTPILFDVEGYLKSEDGGSSLLFYVNEGAVGQDSIKWSNSILPSLAAAARAVIFLVRHEYRFSDEPLWMHLDHYSLTSGGQAMDICQLESMSQDELFAEIHAVVR